MSLEDKMQKSLMKLIEMKQVVNQRSYKGLHKSIQQKIAEISRRENEKNFSKLRKHKKYENIRYIGDKSKNTKQKVHKKVLLPLKFEKINFLKKVPKKKRVFKAKKLKLSRNWMRPIRRKKKNRKVGKKTEEKKTLNMKKNIDKEKFQVERKPLKIKKKRRNSQRLKKLDSKKNLKKRKQKKTRSILLKNEVPLQRCGYVNEFKNSNLKTSNEKRTKPKFHHQSPKSEENEQNKRWKVDFKETSKIKHFKIRRNPTNHWRRQTQPFLDVDVDVLVGHIPVRLLTAGHDLPNYNPETPHITC